MLIEWAMIGAAAVLARRLLRENRAQSGASAATGEPARAEAGDSPPADQFDDSPSPLVAEADDTHAATALPGHDEGADDAELNQRLVLAGSGLVLSTAGAVIAPPLALVSALPTTWVTWPLLKSAYAARHDPDRRWIGLLDLIGVGGALVTGHFFAASLGATLVFAGAKMLRVTRAQSRAEMAHIFGELPKRAVLVVDGQEVEVDVGQLGTDHEVLVRASNIIPVDGVVVSGNGLVDERALTGEAQPVTKVEGDQVFASTMVVEGPLLIRATRAGEETTVAALHRILQSTDDLTAHYRSRGEHIVERGAVPTLALTAATLVVGGTGRALAVSFSGFGYHMRTAAPLSAIAYVNLAARRQILVKDARALELLAAVDTVVFDKTGTLTRERPTVHAVHPAAGYTADRVLAIAAAAEQGQAHPIAEAIRMTAEEDGLDIPQADDHGLALGAGVRARVGGADVQVGSARLLAGDGIDVPADRAGLSDGSTRVYVVVDRAVIGVIELVNAVRPEAAGLVADLAGRGLETVMITGDRRGAAEQVAADLGIARVHAEVLPEDKAAIVRALQAEGRRVCFVGDGINDAIALRAADVSVSLAGASAAATDSASVIMLDGDLVRLASLFDLARDFDATIDRGALLTTVPGVLCVGGVFLFNAGLTGAIMLYNVALAGSVANAMRPLVRARLTRAGETSDRGDEPQLNQGEER